METIIRMLPEFEHKAKAMAKKYKSFVKDYKDFIESLKTNPIQGKSLGGGVYKITELSQVNIYQLACL